MSECVKVVVRCRPLNTREKDLNCMNIVKMDQKTQQVQLVKKEAPDEQPKTFSFDCVFFVDSIQQDMYEQSAFPLVEQIFEGYNGTMFAYGQTGCGKSFTMMGVPKDPVMKGVIPRTFDHIINVIDSDDSGKTFLVMCAYIEIYNEEVRDLLAENHTERLDLKEDPQKGVYVKGLNKVIVKSYKEMDDLMEKGNNNRVVGATKMNATSSRSHSIFSIFIEVQEKIGGDESFKAGKLNLVDLAGSEKQSKTQAEGARLKEATKINLSLSALGNVISALSSGKGGHIPYRDSKLTRLLQDSLGGNTKTIMMAALSPADDNYEETLSTLRYAQRAKNIKNKPIVNMDPKDALLKEYQDEINKLKAMLANGGSLPAEQVHQITRRMSMTNDEQIAYNERAGGIDDDQKQKYHDQLNEKDQALQNEKLEREKLETMLKEMENNKLTGHGQTDEQTEKYKQARQKLKKQRKIQEQMKKDQEEREEQMNDMNRKFNSAQDELDQAKKIISQLKTKHEYLQTEMRDLEKEHELEKQDLLDTIRLQEKDSNLNAVIIDMLLSKREYEIIRNSSTWKEQSSTYVVPPFTFKNKKIQFPKLQAHQAQELVDAEKDNRDLDFGGNQQEDFNNSKGYQNGRQQQHRESRHNTIQSGQQFGESQSSLEVVDEHGFSNPQMRGRQSSKGGFKNQQQNNIKITKLNGTRQKFYSANPVGRNGEIGDALQKGKKASVDKQPVPRKLDPLDSNNTERAELAKYQITQQNQQQQQQMQQQLNNMHYSQSLSPEKPKGKINGVQLNPIQHNPTNMIQNSQLSTSQISGNLSGIMANPESLKKHNGLAPLNPLKKQGNGQKLSKLN